MSRCLGSVVPQLTDCAGAVRLAVIDNDPARSAYPVVTNVNSATGQAVLYAAEPQIGIPYARNRAIDLCLKHGADWLVFLDDDALAGPGWLDSLLWALREYPADVIAGPVEKPLPESPSFWTVSRERQEPAEGAVQRVACTNNVAVRTGIFREHPSLRFDETMRFTGGSDTDFFRRLIALGGTIVWSKQPRVSEPMPPKRLTFRWQMARKYRTACNDIHIYRKLRSLPALYFRRGTGALWRLVSGGALLAGAAALLPFWPHRLKRLVLRGGLEVSWALGTLAGLIGHSAQPYRPDRISPP